MSFVSGLSTRPASLKADIVARGRVVFAGLILLLVGASALYLKTDYDLHRADVATRVATFADSMAEHVQQVFTIVDLALRSIDADQSTAEIVASGPLEDLHQVLKLAQSQSPAMQGLGVIGPKGTTVASATLPQPMPTDLADRDYFLHHRDNRSSVMLISTPVLGRPQNVPAIPVSRRIEAADGSFAGVVAARVDPKYFLRLFSTIGADGVAIFRLDGTAIARYPEVDLLSAKPLPATSPVLARGALESHGTFVGTSPIDGIERIAAFRRIDGLGLIVTASNDMSSVRSAWLARTYPFFLLGTICVVFLVIVALLVQRQARDAAALVSATALAKRNAEQAAEVKGTFLANMSHEIRTPLGGIIGYTDLLLKADQPADQRDWTVKLRSAGEQLLAVINDILDYSKLEAGDFTVAAHPTPLPSLIDEVISLMSAQARARGLFLQSDLEEGLPAWIRVDAVRLRQILINLLSNAIKFTDRGSVIVSVSRLAGAEPILSIIVADTGVGIPKAKLPTIFERFTQVETNVSRGRGGTGLGLSISRRLAELMGGTLTLESEEGVGTTVELRLPLEEAPAREPASTPSLAAVRPGRLLLVDDLPMNLEIAGAMLRSQGHEVETASRGTEAIDRALAGQFDAILLDINLADLDGYEVAAEIRKREPAGRRVPILALSANALPEHILKAIAAGMNGHIAKPIDERLLASQLAAVLSSPDDGRGGPARLPLIDEAAADTIRRLLGKERLLGFKRAFWSVFESFAERAPRLDRESFARESHDLISHAGNVGYMRLSDACRQASDAARDPFGAFDARSIERIVEVAGDTRRADGG